jgi:hypothetical protein
MRTSAWLAAAALGLGLAGTAPAQSALTWGGTGTTRQYHIVGTDSTLSNASAIASPQTLSSTSWSLTSFFHTPTPMTNQRVRGSSQFPTYQQMPGTDYLKAFRARTN